MTTNVDHILIYQDTQDQWRWSGIARNGEIVAQGEAHTRPQDAARAAHGALGHDIPIVDQAPKEPA